VGAPLNSLLPDRVKSICDQDGSHLFFSLRHDLGENACELDPYRRNYAYLVQEFQECISDMGA
jgi:hypothetical protein